MGVVTVDKNKELILQPTKKTPKNIALKDLHDTDCYQFLKSKP